MYQDIKVIKTKTIKSSRKVQECWQCGRDIPIGSSLVKDTLLVIGDIASAYSCIKCTENK